MASQHVSPKLLEARELEHSSVFYVAGAAQLLGMVARNTISSLEAIEFGNEMNHIGESTGYSDDLRHGGDQDDRGDGHGSDEPTEGMDDEQPRAPRRPHAPLRLS